jgi:hypothetical protein
LVLLLLLWAVVLVSVVLVSVVAGCLSEVVQWWVAELRELPPEASLQSPLAKMW